MRDIDLIANERRAQRVASRITPYRTNEGRTSASASCRNGLVGTFPTAGLEVSMSRHGFAWMRQSLGKSDEIEIGRTNDHHIECIGCGHEVVPFGAVPSSSLAA
jgi:hypothetical protein